MNWSLTSVCKGLSALLAPLPLRWVIRGVLREEGEHVAAGGSQGGVQRRGNAELYHRSEGEQERRRRRTGEEEKATVSYKETFVCTTGLKENRRGGEGDS